ncbi:hypothetical protein QQ056_06390 [Oscillatoria laete-virens NRMC-F 0139]|nr:hypothetical protein [Oscillatoria laete-virens]MDL5053173.1 hypothetical protein [Oscillatoria laete-virens NRMC-F 0139]
MSKKITPFFATKNDIDLILAEVDKLRSIKIVAAGLFDSLTIELVAMASKLHPTANYLLFYHDELIEYRIVEQRGGGRKYAIDQLTNPRTIAMRPGGLVDQNFLISGQIGTANDDPVSQDIYKVAARCIKRTFSKVKSYYVGQEALELLDKGVRLAPNINSPKTYDLVR